METVEQTLHLPVPDGPVDRTCLVCGVDDDQPAHLLFAVINGEPVQIAHHLSCPAPCCPKENV